MPGSAGATICLTISLSVASVATARAASDWRFWNKSDGFAESVVFGLTSDGTGRLLVKYGAVPRITVLDGYQVSHVPSPYVYGRLFNSPDKSLWSWDAEGIVIRDNSGWHKRPDPEIAGFAKTGPMLRIPWFMQSYYRLPGDRMDFAPAGNDSGVILFPDRLVEWSRNTGRKRVIRTAAGTRLLRFRDIQTSGQSASGRGTSINALWITGETGIGRLTRVRDGFDWIDFPAPGHMTDLVNPIEGAGGEVFVSALRPDGKHAVMRFASGIWKEIYVGGTDTLQGWRGPENEIWIQNGRKIVELDGSGPGDLGGGLPITGLTTGVVTGPDQNFWLGTTEGVARYSPALWRTPRGLEWADAAVSAITGDKLGRIWFLNGPYLVLDDHERWQRFRLPSGARTTMLIDYMAVLENGDLALRGDSLADIAVFHPGSGTGSGSGAATFRIVAHPGGKRIGFLGQRGDGTALVQVFQSDNSKWRFEAFDGTRFLPLNQPEMTSLNDLRTVLEARNGDFWLGAADSLGQIHNGKLREFDAKDGITEKGVLSAIESPDGRIILAGRESITEYNGKVFRLLRSIDAAESVSFSPDGLLWAGSGSGIHRYVPGQPGQSGQQGHWITNTSDDGLPATAVRKVYADSQGRIWAGTSHGVALFYPEADPDPPVTNIIDDQNLRETPPGGEVRLAFSGADKWKFTAAERLTFSWRLDDSAWSEFSSSHFASFKGLHSGAHRFAVKAMDRNGNIDPSPANYQFSVLLPWYRQTDFLILASIALFVIVGLSRMAWRHHRRLQYQSTHDPLTTLANRHAFEQSFHQALAEARATGAKVAVLLLDLDHFKPINDNLGHQVGDRFLQEVSRRLLSAIRKQDTLARLGGDEFAVLMPLISSGTEAEKMASAILDLLRQPYLIDSFELTGSASIGVSLFPEHGDDAATLHRLADMAMYQCKAQNKNGYAVFDPETNRLDFRSAQMAGMIREALERNYFHLQYQPVRFGDGSLFGFEALIRLEHPQFGTVQPGDFISIAEDTGLIVPIGNWVMTEACRQMAAWRAAGYPRLHVNVNVSTVQLAKADFAEGVRSILRDTELDPAALTIEITETTMMRRWEESLAQIDQLRELGITVALDDFGTGYSTLSALHLLPVDYVKIDRSFIQRVQDEASEGLIVIHAMTQLVHRFGLAVVAEGVETPQQLSGLRAAGCDLLQGYLLGRPMTVTMVQRLLEMEMPSAKDSSDDLKAMIEAWLPAVEIRQP
jgi:diguanylate cyclase (GGDEF)-like protein